MALIIPNTIANQIPADGDKLDQNFDTIQNWANQEAITRDGATAMTSPLLLPGPPVAPNQAATKGYVDAAVPVGVMWAFGGDTAPTGWELCRGQALSRATYAALFAVIGTKFGAGDGTTTFNLPSMQGRSPMGYWPGGSWAATNGQMIGSADATLPAHAHAGANHLHAFTGSGGGSATMSWGEVYQATAEPVDNVNVFAVRIGDGFTINLKKFPTTSYPGSVGVNVSGTTSGVDRDITTGPAGTAATNANIGPVVVTNFIMRVQ